MFNAYSIAQPGTDRGNLKPRFTIINPRPELQLQWFLQTRYKIKAGNGCKSAKILMPGRHIWISIQNKDGEREWRLRNSLPLSQSKPRSGKGSARSMSCIRETTPWAPLFQVARHSVQPVRISDKVRLQTKSPTRLQARDKINPERERRQKVNLITGLALGLLVMILGAAGLTAFALVLRKRECANSR